MKYSRHNNLYNTVFITLSYLLFSCAKKPLILHPSVESITYSVYASGFIKSDNQYQVYSKANGVITDIYVKDGDLIKKGQAIVRLSDVTQKLNYENAKLNANYLSIHANQEKIQQAQAEVEVAQLKMDNDASLLERQKKLWAQEIGSKNELDLRELAYKNSVNLYHASKLKLNDLKKQLEFQTQQTERTVAISSSSMNDFTIKSEMNGRLYSLNKEKGEMVNNQSPIAIIGDDSQFYIELQVDEYDISKIKIGQQVFLTMDSYKGEVFEAIIRKVFPIMNEKSKSFKVEASFTKLPNNLYPNLSAEANIVITKKEKALTIPRNYIMEGDYVLLSNNEKRKVIVGLKDYEKAEIISGITEKDELIKPQ